MTNKQYVSQLRSARPNSHAHAYPAILMLLLGWAAAYASTPTTNDVGFSYKILSSGPPVTVEIRLKPRHSYESVAVEAGSGVATMTPCAFSTVLASHSYVCRVTVTGKPGDAAMTLNLVARHTVAGGALPETEIHHISVTNAAYVPPAKGKAVSNKPTLTSSPTKQNK